MATRKKKETPVAFQEQLVLFRYFLDQFGREALGDFAKKLNTPDAEGYDDNQNTLFYVYLRDFCRKLKISKDQLRVYDENICATSNGSALCAAESRSNTSSISLCCLRKFIWINILRTKPDSRQN